MKNILLATAVLASSSVFAQGVIPSIDYSHCQQALGFYGPQLNHGHGFQTIMACQASTHLKVDLTIGNIQFIVYYKDLRWLDFKKGS